VRSILSDIHPRQNESHFQELLSARSGIYRLATIWQLTQLFLTMVAPVILSLVSLHFSWLRPYVACYALLASVLDILLIDRLTKKLIKQSALASEMFDTDLFKIPWNSFVCGKRLQPEEVRDFSKYCSTAQEPNLVDWYPVAIAAAPHEVATLICQRTNLFYDGRVRGRSAWLLLAFPIAYTIIILALALWWSLSFNDLVLTVVSPSAAVLIWSLRERFRQLDAIAAGESLRSEVENSWISLIKGGEERSAENLSRIRQLQDGIFLRRSQNPLPLPFIYRIIRSNAEDVMNYGAEKLLENAGYPLAQRENRRD
jgi:Zn-dependent protease with chaperone function